MMVLNKYLAHAGLCSRRKAVEFIKEGVVTINGSVIKNPAHRVTAQDTVKLHETSLRLEQKTYILLNKPKDFITTTADERGRKTVMDLVEGCAQGRVCPVGRLDRTTTGLLLMTNDGELMQKLSHPRNAVQKTYHVSLNQALVFSDLEKIRAGIVLYDGKAHVDAINYLPTRPRHELKVILHTGKNRIIRRIFEHLGYEVKKLDRTHYAFLSKKNLRVGEWRYLTAYEIEELKKC